MKYKDKAGQIYPDINAAVRTWCHVQHEPCEMCPIGRLKTCVPCQDWVSTCPTIVSQIIGVEPVKDDQEAKADGGKLHPSYVSPKAIIAIAKIREFGTAKYGSPDNWKNVSADRYHEALLRHALGMWNDPYAIDPESGMPHLYHLMCNGNFLCDLEADHEKHASSPD